MSSKVCPSFVACVVGLSLEHGEAFGRKQGIGKSCLCHRFTNPGFDDYITKHQSLYALHEFESRVINNDHYLYWGSPVKSFPTVDSKTVDLRVHVIEQTVFYQDITCQPFTIITKPDRPDFYNKRIVGQIESPGKVAYRSRDEIGSPSSYNAAQYPAGISKDTRGFVVVIDVSQSGTMFEKQIKRAEKVCEYLGKHKRKTVIAATKRDAMVPDSLVKVYDLKKKFKTHVVEVSAEHGLNVDEVFRVLAHKLFKKSIAKLSKDVQTYPDAAQSSLFAKGSARRAFTTFVDKRVRNPHETIDSIENNEEYKLCVNVIGKFETDKVFALQVIYLYNERIGMMYAGVSDNPEMREEFLEDFLTQRSDLSLYTQDLREWIKHVLKDLDSNSSSPVQDTLYDHPKPAIVDDYQLFQPPRTPSPSQQTQDSGFHQGGATSNCFEDDLTGEDSDKDSYYSDSGGSEGPDYVNFDPKNPPEFGEPKDLLYDDIVKERKDLYDDIVKEPNSDYTDTISPAQLVAAFHPTAPETNAPIESVRKEESVENSSSIKNRAMLLGGMLGHTPAAEKEPARAGHQDVPSPSPVSRQSPESSVRRQPGPPPVKPKPKALKPLSEAPLPVLPDKDTQDQATPSGPKESPKPSRVAPPIPKPFLPKKRLPSSQSTDDDSPSQSKTPPPVAKRISSLPRNRKMSSSIESDDSAPSTPKLTRKPSRPAPLPPMLTNSPTLRKSTVRDPPAPEVKPPTPPVPEPAPQEGEKPRLRAIREKVAAKRMMETPNNDKVIESGVKLPATLSEFSKPKRKDYEKSTLGDKPYLVPLMIPEKIDAPPPLPSRAEIENVNSSVDMPPIPVRTKEMLIIDNPVVKSPKGSKRVKDVSEVVTFKDGKESPKTSKSPSHRDKGSMSPKKSFFRSKRSPSSESETVTSPSRKVGAQERELPPIPTASAPRSTFLVMKGRPLPLKPFEGHEDDEIEDQHDYEVFEFGGHNPDPERPLGMPRGRRSMDAGISHSVKQNVTKQNSLDSATVNRVDPGLTQPWLNDVAKSLNIVPTVKKSKTFHGADHSRRPAAPIPSKLPHGIWPDYIDGYVNPEPPPPGFIPQQRELPPTPLEVLAKGLPSAKEDNPDYDYPDRREFLTLPTRKKGVRSIPVPPRFPPAQNQGPENRHSVASDQYIHMEGAHVVKDDSYVNIEQYVRPGLQQQYSQDDIGVYMNLPGPDVARSLPPRQTLQSPPTGGAIADTLASVRPSTQWEEPSEQFPESSSIVPSKQTPAHSLDEHVSFKNANDQTYMNIIDVSANLPVSFLSNREQEPKAPEISPRVPRRSKINLPPRNIKRDSMKH